MNEKIALRTITAMHYISCLRKSRSLPVLTEADDGLKYVLKFSGSDHRVRILVSEFLGGQIAVQLGLQIPEFVFANLDAGFALSETGEELPDLLDGRQALNMGLHYLSGAIAYDPSVEVDAFTASKIVWMDAFTTNIDRTCTNTNLLLWQGELWVIDNGASFYFLHFWTDFNRYALSSFPYIKDHVLLPQASRLEEANTFARHVLTDEFFLEIITLIPEVWLLWSDVAASPDEIRRVYFNFLKTRLHHSRNFLKEAKNARK